MARLILNPGTPQARELVLKDGLNTVGRRDDNDLAIPDPSVSGAHCQLIVSNGTVQLRDLGSTNGTFVGGVRVTDINLRNGQQVQFGGVPLIFESDAPPAAPASVSAPSAPTTAPPRIAVPVPVPVARVATVAAAVPAAPAVAAPGSRLRISGHAPPPVATPDTEETPAEVAPAPAFHAPANARCKYHPKSYARWICTGCHKTYCDLCVADRHGAGAQKFCRSCGAAASALDVHIEAPAEKSFFRELPRAFVYPFRGTGILVLIVATILFAAMEYLSFGIFGLLMKAAAIGYLFSYMQNIIHSTAAEDEAMPELPGMDDLFSGFFRLVGTILISFGPAMVLAYFAIAQQQPMAGIAMIPAIIFGCLYLPMAFLAVAIKDNVMAANPLIVVPSIIRVPLEYLVTAILSTGLFGLRWLGNFLTGMMAGPLEAETMGAMFLAFGVSATWAFVSVYLLTVTMRILGLLYLTKKDRLGWS